MHQSNNLNVAQEVSLAFLALRSHHFGQPLTLQFGKLVIVGDEACRKTSLLSCFTRDISYLAVFHPSSSIM